MENAVEIKKQPPKKSYTARTVPIRVDKDIAKSISKAVARLNKKEFGRKITISDYVAAAISKMNTADERCDRHVR